MPNIFDTLRDGAGAIINRVGSGLNTAAGRLMPIPPGGLFSDEDVQAARRQGLIGLGASLLSNSGPAADGFTPSFGEALGHGLLSAQDSYKGALGDRLSMQQAIAQRDQMQREQAAQGEIGQIMSAAPNDIPSQRHALMQAMGRAAAVNDMKSVTAFAEVLKSLPDESAGPTLQHVDFGDKIGMVDPRTGKVVVTYPKGHPPRDPNAPDPQAGMAAQRQFTRAQGLSDDFRQYTRTYADVANQIGTLQSVGPAAMHGDAAAQISMVYSYMKLMDPGSTVRETEFANAQNAGGVPDRVRTMFNKLQQGSILAPRQVQDFMNQSRTIQRSWQQRFAPIKRQFEDRARRQGVNPADVVYDYFGTFGSPDAAPGGTTSGNANNVRQFLRH